MKEKENNKTFESTGRKRLIYVLVSVFCLIGLFFLVSVGFYFPRSIASYIHEDILDIERFEIVQLDQTVVFDVKEDKNLIEEIVQKTVVPRYFFNEKTAYAYQIILYFESGQYIIDGHSIQSKEKTQYFRVLNGSIYSLIRDELQRI